MIISLVSFNQNQLYSTQVYYHLKTIIIWFLSNKVRFMQEYEKFLEIFFLHLK